MEKLEVPAWDDSVKKNKQTKQSCLLVTQNNLRFPTFLFDSNKN